MSVISKRGLFRMAARYADGLPALRLWFDTAVRAMWRNLVEVLETFPATYLVGDLAIFNIKGSHYRLIVRIVFQYQRIYVKEFLTHAEYDRGGWKKWLA